MSPATAAALCAATHEASAPPKLALVEPIPFELTAKAHQLLEERFGPDDLLETDRFRCRGAYGRRWTS